MRFLNAVELGATVASEVSTRAEAWALFDKVLIEYGEDPRSANPWILASDGSLKYSPDFEVFEKLLGVPLLLNASTQSGVPALALDVWLSYELRRSGFDPDSTWPRASHPRILSRSVVNLLDSLPKRLREQIEERISMKQSIRGVSSASANILGKNYLKQVDVIMTDWATGPELLISTKRMDSSFGKNAANRVEESYGDAKNLRSRHPLAALGFAFGLKSDILQKEPETAEWIIDLLRKLGEEEDAYHATCLIMIDYSQSAPSDSVTTFEDPLLEPGPDESDNDLDEVESPSAMESALQLGFLPSVRLDHQSIPRDLSPERFLASMVNRVLDISPVTMHREARTRRKSAVAESRSGDIESQAGLMGSAHDDPDD